MAAGERRTSEHHHDDVASSATAADSAGQPSSGYSVIAAAPSALVFLAGVWLATSPFVLGYRGTDDAYWNDVIVGAAIAAVALVRIAAPVATVPLSLINMGLGVWLIAAPLALKYHVGVDATVATWNSLIVGLSVMLLAAAGAVIGGNVSVARPSADR